MSAETSTDHEDSLKDVICPFCDGSETELFSLFGQSLLSSQYYCRHCRTVFEAVRWHDAEEG